MVDLGAAHREHGHRAHARGTAPGRRDRQASGRSPLRPRLREPDAPRAGDGPARGVRRPDPRERGAARVRLRRVRGADHRADLGDAPRLGAVPRRLPGRRDAGADGQARRRADRGAARARRQHPAVRARPLLPFGGRPLPGPADPLRDQPAAGRRDRSRSSRTAATGRRSCCGTAGSSRGRWSWPTSPPRSPEPSPSASG